MVVPCTVCGREFTVATNMYRHRQKVHSWTTEQAALPSNTPTDADATPGPSNVASMTEPSMKRPRCDVIVDDDAIFEHGKEVFECDVCNMYFLSQEELDKHVQLHALHREFCCQECARTYTSYEKLKMHIKTAHSAMSAPQSSRKRLRAQQHGGGAVRERAFTQVESSVNDSARTYRLPFTEDAPGEEFVADLGNAVLVTARTLIEQLAGEANIKWYASLTLVFHKATQPNVVTEPPVYFRTEPVASTSSNPLELQLKVALRRLWHQIDRYEANGSGWVVDRLRELDVHVVSYDPLRAGIYLTLPKWLVALRAVLNIHNTNDDDW